MNQEEHFKLFSVDNIVSLGLDWTGLALAGASLSSAVHSGFTEQRHVDNVVQ